MAGCCVRCRERTLPLLPPLDLCRLVRADLNSAHVFVFAHWVLKLLEAKEYLISIRADLVPYLMRAQYRSKEALPADIHAKLLADCSKNFLAMVSLLSGHCL